MNFASTLVPAISTSSALTFLNLVENLANPPLINGTVSNTTPVAPKPPTIPPATLSSGVSFGSNAVLVPVTPKNLLLLF